jgi:hypothetical protein
LKITTQRRKGAEKTNEEEHELTQIGTNEENQRGSFSFFIFIRDIRSYSCSFVDSLLSLFFLSVSAPLRLCVKYCRKNLFENYHAKAQSRRGEEKTNEENQRGSFSFFIFIRDIRSYSCSFVDSLLSLFFLCVSAPLRLCVKYFRENLYTTLC